MRNSFLKYMVCVAAVVAGVAVVDRVAGYGLDVLLENVPVSQDIGKGRYAIKEVSADVVIVGSSRASHHYVSKMMADSLGCSVYNVGRDGCFLSDNLCVINAILDRYSPKVIILEVADNYLYERRVPWVTEMFPYYWKSDYTKDIIDSELGWRAKYQLASKLYCYNNNSFRLFGYGLKGMLSGPVADPLCGYAPLPYLEKKVPMELKDFYPSRMDVISSSRRSHLESMLDRANSQGVKMVLICSPIYKNSIGSSIGREALMDICSSKGVLYYDHSSDSLFLEHPEWFKDTEHLNCKGAEAYTEIVIKELYDNIISNL